MRTGDQMKQTVRELLIVIAVASYVEVRLRRGTLPALAGRLGIRLDLHSGVVGTSGATIPGWCALRITTTHRVLRHWPFGDTCLRRCLVMGQRLHGLDPVLRIGVRAAEEGRLEAHSWLEIDGRAIDPSAVHFLPLTATAG